MKEFIRSYMLEAKWLHDGYTPTLEEHMSNAFVSSGYSMLTTTCFVGMGEMVTDESFKWALKRPPIVMASCAIARLMDDITSHKVCLSMFVLFFTTTTIHLNFFLIFFFEKLIAFGNKNTGGARKKPCRI